MYKSVIIRTLKHFEQYDIPLTANELFELAIFTDDEIPLPKDHYKEELRNLLVQGLIFSHKDYYSTSNSTLPLKVKKREIIDQSEKDLTEKYKGLLNNIRDNNISGVILTKNFSLKDENSFSGEHLDILVITEKDSEHLVKLIFKIYLKFKRIKYSELKILNIENLELPINLNWAYAISTGQTLFNKGGIDKLLLKNKWIFRLLKNYPMQKISDSISTKRSNNKASINKLTKIINNLLGLVIH